MKLNKKTLYKVRMHRRLDNRFVHARLVSRNGDSAKFVVVKNFCEGHNWLEPGRVFAVCYGNIERDVSKAILQWENK